MKKILVLALLVVVFAPFQNAKAADPGVIEMKLGHFAADSHPGNLAVEDVCRGRGKTDQR